MDTQFTSPTVPTSGAFVVIIGDDDFQKDLDGRMAGGLTKIKNLPDFKGKCGDHVIIPAPHGLDVSKLIVVHAESAEHTAQSLAELGGKIGSILLGTREEEAFVLVPYAVKLDGCSARASAHIAHGLALRTWTFDKYMGKKENKKMLVRVQISSPKIADSKEFFAPLKALESGVLLTRHVVSEPANVVDPAYMANQAKELEALGIKTTILDEKEMARLGMNALLGVGQGSVKDSYLVMMEWNGSGTDEAPLAIVGKGVTFDTGGISIKPSGDMDEMKWDMGGSGVVLGLMKALASRKAKANVVGVMGLVENMPDGNAQRPGDIVTSLSGQTIEILNTDAEGRLVLADALWYTQDRFKPKAMIDLATLTGAIVVALGHEYAGFFSNDMGLAAHIKAASVKTGEKVWHLPLDDAYDQDINSTIADVKNIGSGRGAGSITAAQFLQRFVNNVPWAHIDIAGTAWDKKGKALSAKGATAFGVRLLNQLIQDQYETA